MTETQGAFLFARASHVATDDTLATETIAGAARYWPYENAREIEEEIIHEITHRRLDPCNRR